MHGSEAKFKLQRMPKLSVKLNNAEEWSRAIGVSMSGHDVDFMLIKELNNTLSTPEARALYNKDKDVAGILKILMVAASISGASSSSAVKTKSEFKASVKDNRGLRTPMQRPGESAEAKEAREDAEAGGLVWQYMMNKLTPATRGKFIKSVWFVDYETDKVESKAGKEKRMRCWSEVVEPSLRRYHSDLLSSVCLARGLRRAPGEIKSLGD